MDKKILVNVAFVTRFDDGSKQSIATGKNYLFVSHEEVEVDDLVVVDTQYGFALGVVKSIAERLPRGMNMGIMKDVVARVDVNAFNARKAKAEKLVEIKAAMDKKVKQIQANVVYETFAEKDPALQAMLDEYNTLLGGQ